MRAGITLRHKGALSLRRAPFGDKKTQSFIITGQRLGQNYCCTVQRLENTRGDCVHHAEDNRLLNLFRWSVSYTRNEQNSFSLKCQRVTRSLFNPMESPRLLEQYLNLFISFHFIKDTCWSIYKYIYILLSP